MEIYKCWKCKRELPVSDFAENEEGEKQDICMDCADALFEMARAEQEMEMYADYLDGGD